MFSNILVLDILTTVPYLKVRISFDDMYLSLSFEWIFLSYLKRLDINSVHTSDSFNLNYDDIIYKSVSFLFTLGHVNGSTYISFIVYFVTYCKRPNIHTLPYVTMTQGTKYNLTRQYKLSHTITTTKTYLMLAISE